MEFNKFMSALKKSAGKYGVKIQIKKACDFPQKRTDQDLSACANGLKAFKKNHEK